MLTLSALQGPLSPPRTKTNRWEIIFLHRSSLSVLSPVRPQRFGTAYFVRTRRDNALMFGHPDLSIRKIAFSTSQTETTPKHFSSPPCRVRDKAQTSPRHYSSFWNEPRTGLLILIFPRLSSSCKAVHQILLYTVTTKADVEHFLLQKELFGLLPKMFFKGCKALHVARTLDGEVGEGGGGRVGGAAGALETRLAHVHATVSRDGRLDREAASVHGQQVLDAVVLDERPSRRSLPVPVDAQVVQRPAKQQTCILYVRQHKTFLCRSDEGHTGPQRHSLTMGPNFQK